MEELRDNNGLTEKEFLDTYRPGYYERPSVAVDTVLFTVTRTKEDNYRKLPGKELKILLIKRSGHPYSGLWALPGDFVNPDETAEDAAMRELDEETGVDDIYLEQLYTFSEPERVRGMWVISCSYLALADSDRVYVEAGDDVGRVEWFTVKAYTDEEILKEFKSGFEKVTEYKIELSCKNIFLSGKVRHTMLKNPRGVQNTYEITENNGIAFDHVKIILYALERLRGKVKYTDIALNLMPEYFTLTDLQRVYEIILGKEQIKAAFRRKYSILAEPTDKMTSDAGHRPSRLYRRKWLTY